MTKTKHTKQHFNSDIEQVVLGAMMLERSALQLGIGIIKKADVFFVESHQLIYRGILSLYTDGQPVDILTVTQRLTKMGALKQAGGAYAVAAVTEHVSGAAHLESHARLLMELYTRRRMARLGYEMQEKAYEVANDPFELLQQLAKGSSEIMDDLITKKPQTAAYLYGEAIKQIHAGIGKEGLTGIPSGITMLDKVTGGWQKTDLIIAAGRPGMGKTALAVQVAKNAALRFGKRGAIFSLEMSGIQLMNRMIANEAGVTGSQLAKSRLTEDELARVTKASHRLMTEDLYIDDAPGLSVLELRSKCTKLKADGGLEWVIVDYLQLMVGDKSGSRENEISSISRGLKILAKELEVPVIALAQLSRAVEARADKRPMLSDLRESGAIEQDADMVLFLFRPEYYGIQQDEMGNPTENTLELIIAKHRNGPTETVTTGCNLASSRVYDLIDDWGTAPSAPSAPSAVQVIAPPAGYMRALPKSDFDND